MTSALQTTSTQQAGTDRLPPPSLRCAGLRGLYLAALTWAFTLFSTIRVLTYLPTIAAIVASGDSSQHSLFTWLSWTGANLTMAAWLYEQSGQKVNRAVGVNIGNALMCLLTTAVILSQRV
jgi:hypothetical protein